MNENDTPKFTCNVCGEHSLTVTHVWSVLAGEDSERWQEWGPLKDNHHWQFEFTEKVKDETDDLNDADEIDNIDDEDSDDDQGDAAESGDFGEFQENDSASEPEEYEKFETETNRESDEFYVNCTSCDREIEFGWSQPDRRGLIMPVEFTDFNPSESWPDPKYLESWQQKGWLRTMDDSSNAV
jgi:hypothetical protein